MKIVIAPLILLTAQAEELVSGTLSGVIFLDTRKKDKQESVFSYHCSEAAFGLLLTYLSEGREHLPTAVTVMRALTLRNPVESC